MFVTEIILNGDEYWWISILFCSFSKKCSQPVYFFFMIHKWGTNLNLKNSWLKESSVGLCVFQTFYDKLYSLQHKCFPDASKNPPARQEMQMWVWSLGHWFTLEEDMAAHSSILAWDIPWTEEPGRLHGVAKSGIWPNTSVYGFWEKISEFKSRLCLWRYL